MAHITGGGITENLPRVLPDNCAAEIDLSSWELPPVFKWLQEAGNIEAPEMLKTFNCGVGMILVVSENQAEVATSLMKMENIPHFKIGQLKTKTSEPVEYING
jgi:phosphoribosylformylglycinamidine cyclo-ligase